MNKEDIIRMANESNLLGIYADEAIDSVIRFAALVASAERESLRESFRVVTAAEASAAILHEREACAKLLEQAAEAAKNADPQGFVWQAVEASAEVIRARGHVATNDTSQERVDKTSEIVHEPVAWVSSEELLVMRGNALGGAKDWRINVGLVKQENDAGLYTTPPQRKPLTDEQIQYAFRTNSVTVDDGNAYMVAGKRAINIARAIEAAHGIKGEA